MLNTLVGISGARSTLDTNVNSLAFHKSAMMRHFSILNALTLAASVFAKVPKAIISSAILDNRALPPPGCANFYGDDQHVKLYSGGAVFEMWIPTNGSTYNVGKPFARLNCNEVSSTSQIRNPACAECWDRVDHVEILTPGSCSFALTNDDKKIVSMESDHTKGKNPFPVAGYLALVTCRKPGVKVARDIDITQFSCMETHSSNITMWTGSSEYVLSVPANETVFDVIGPDSKLGCVGPIGWKYAMCQACNFPIQSLTLSIAAGTCAFNFSGDAELVYHNARFGPLALPSPTQIWSVQCGLGHPPFDPRVVLSETPPAPVACPAWADKTTIQLVDGRNGVHYDLEIRPDGSRFQTGRPPYDVGCLRRDKLYTDQCFPCTISLAEIHIQDVDCLVELSYQNKTAHFESWHGPVEYDYPSAHGETVLLLSIQCHRQSVQRSSTNDVTSLPKTTGHDLEQRDAKSGCIGGAGIALHDIEGNYSALAVPPDMQYYSLAGSNPELECYFFWEIDPTGCHSCYKYEWASMLPTEEMEECRFKIEGWKELLVWPAEERETKYFNPPIKLLGVQCGFGYRNNPPVIEARSVDLPQESNSPTIRQINDLAERQVHRFKTSSDVAVRSTLR